ncbi:MAG: M48 family metalloprotease [Desulfobulbaceae bacterium]|nr:M48 family metalloprotease [Desulfobulbaceae bacterium]HIJ91031.1 M48 family metalloprotease [Deltaproteobacteria bacterium]
MYNNLIYLLVVILILTTGGIPEQPQIPWPAALLLFSVKGVLFNQLARHFFRRNPGNTAARYFAVEQRLSILAIVFLAVDIFLLEGRYYLSRLPLTEQLPVVAHLAGIILFFGYLCLLWLAARPSYQRIFTRALTARSFVTANLKINLAILLPWLFISILFDLVQLAPFPQLQEFLASPWGEPLLVLLSLFGLIFFLPLAIIRLWGCTPLPPGPTRHRLEEFCRGQRLRFADILLWPIFEGRMLTAGVMGLTGRFRYLLVTPALLEATTPEEIEAVMAHELGHVKRFHLQLYLFLFLGFALLAQVSGTPLLQLLLSSDFFYQLVALTGKSPDTILALAGALILFALMLGYFRFIFGFFMRNFERQADLHALAAMGHASPLIRVFEKIALLSGNIRDLPSWHHFGLGQRIDFLRGCEENPGWIPRHHRKVHLTLILYTAVMLTGAVAAWRMPQDSLGETPKARFAEALIRQKIQEQPDNDLWFQLLGDLQYSLNQEQEAYSSYEQALRLAPANVEALNNLAWLLLTARETKLRNPERALLLAQKAAAEKITPHVLDTLATAYWANGNREEALALEKEAGAMTGTHQEFYRGQMERFRTTRYSASTNFPEAGQTPDTP